MVLDEVGVIESVKRRGSKTWELVEKTDVKIRDTLVGFCTYLEILSED